jgi:hypothetical protein
VHNQLSISQQQLIEWNTVVIVLKKAIKQLIVSGPQLASFVKKLITQLSA